MEEYENSLRFVIRKNKLKIVQGIKVIKIKDNLKVWIWSESAVVVYEVSGRLETNYPQDNSSQNEHLCFETTLKASVLTVFHWPDEDICYITDSCGYIYSIQFPTRNTMKDSLEFMEVDEVKDMFGSPQSGDVESKWKESLIMKIENCDKVLSACQLRKGVALLTKKEDNLFSFVYLIPEFDLKLILEFDHYTFSNHFNTFKGEVVSSCEISLMSPSLKQLFQENLELFDCEVVIAGLTSGLVLWFCANMPNKGPFVLCSLYQQVQGIYWTKDTKSGLYNSLSIILTSGRTVTFNQEKSFTSCLPDKVKSSCSVKQHFVTSNFVDCYTSELQLGEDQISLNCVSLPIKGVCAMTCVPDSDSILAATIHGSVYVFNPTSVASTSSPQFVIPSQNLLDNMLTQTLNLEKIYKSLSEEDKIIKAITAAMSANSLLNIFNVSVKIFTGDEFLLTVQLKNTILVFSHDLWQACVEIIDGQGERKTELCKLNQDFSSSHDLTLRVSHSLSIGDVVFVELILFLDNQQPIMSVPLNKIEIDACHLMVLKVLTPNDRMTSPKSFENILQRLNNEILPKEKTEFKQFLKLSTNVNADLLLRNALQESCSQISDTDWSKISGGRKHSIQVTINNTLVHLDFDVASKEIVVTSCDVKLCHDVKRSIMKRLVSSEIKVFSDSVVSEFQALHQIFDIEKLRDDFNITSLDTLHKKIRSLVSPQLTA